MNEAVEWTWWVVPSVLSIALICIPGHILYNQAKRSVKHLRITPDRTKMYITKNILSPEKEHVYLAKGSKLTPFNSGYNNYNLQVQDEEGSFHEFLIFLPEEKYEKLEIPHRQLLLSLLEGNSKELLKYKFIHSHE